MQPIVSCRNPFGKKTVKNLATTVGSVVLALVALALVLGLVWVIQGNDFFMYQYFAPKYEDARREVFENTKSYKEGMAQELQNMQFEYVKADEKHKDALASVILHRTADLDLNKLPEDLQTFVEKLRRERNLSK